LLDFVKSAICVAFYVYGGTSIAYVKKFFPTQRVTGNLFRTAECWDEDALQ
jgi:hypothetical protein